MARNPSMKEDLFTCAEEQLKGQIQNCLVKAKWGRNEYDMMFYFAKRFQYISIGCMKSIFMV